MISELSTMKIKFVDLNPDVISALRGVVIDAEVGNIFNYPASAIVTAGNSFGFMDGGIDLAMARMFPEVEMDVQRTIKSEYYGELPIGQAFAVHTGNNNQPHLIYAPTMRTGMVLHQWEPYLAMRASVIVAKKEGFGSIVVCGLGTGTGQVSPHIHAVQMRMAIDHIEKGYFPKNFTESYHNTQKLLGRQ